ncbi:hypothetical protein [Paenibacillus sp.]|uniref:hypothetical protein n=1 Tax=Paenibacillus sp. TaxID=58172 RepID=UPI002D595391|nr:hypothetical protein [Paenibacillus sp.]HZG57033.1 hypothetical protein [Paenibacillus sp.]
MTHIWKLTLTGAAGVGLLAGCAGEAPGQRDGTPGAEPVVVITTAKALRDNDILKDGDTLEDNPVTRWARDRLGIVQQNKWVVTDENGALGNRVKLALSSGEPLPDVLYLSDKEIPELLPLLAASGQIMDIREAFDEYASERVKEAYAKNPDVWKTVSYGGSVWGLPQISDGKIGDPILWIRQDWLDKLGLAPPKTLAELEIVLDGFTTSDPDGNGQDDTVGIAVAGETTLNGWMGDVSFVFGAYGKQPYQWNRMPDGSLAYGSVQPEVETALARLAGWYTQGYLHRDFGTHDEFEAVELFAQGKAGVLSGPGWMGGWPLGELGGTMPAGAIRPYPVPSHENGTVGRVGTKPSYGSYFFRKGFAHMEKAFRYWDVVYGSLIEDPNSDFKHGYAEGYDYILVNGEAVYDFEGGTSTAGNLLLFSPGSTPPGVIEGPSIEQRVFAGSQSSPYERRMAHTSSRLFLEGRIVGDLQLQASEPDQFMGPHTPAMASKGPYLKQLEKETFLKIVYGEAEPDAFDAFVSAWFREGGKEIAREVNAWDRETAGAD